MTQNGFTAAEIAALEAKGLAVHETVLIETKTLQLQVVGTTTDPATGKPMALIAFIAPLPADLLRLKPVVLGPDGQPVGGGLLGAMPIPSTVRVLLQQDAMNPAYVPECPAVDIPA